MIKSYLKTLGFKPYSHPIHIDYIFKIPYIKYNVSVLQFESLKFILKRELVKLNNDLNDCKILQYRCTMDSNDMILVLTMLKYHNAIVQSF
jgi:hypothetical protein